MVRRVRTTSLTPRPRSTRNRDGGTRETMTQPPPSAAREANRLTSIPPTLSASVVQNGIVAAAMKVFARRGFTATRVEDVLDEAGIARRTFYRYFTSKEDVLAAAYDLATGELLRAFDAVSEPAADPLAAARAGIDLYLDFHVENAALLRVLLEQSARSDSPLTENRRRVRAHVLRSLSHASEGRSGGPVDEFTHLALVSALEGVAIALLEGSPSRTSVERAKAAIHALMKSALR